MNWKLSLACAVVVIFSGPPSAYAQQAHAAFTIVERTTYYDARGEVTLSSNSSRYYSASGDWRFVGTVGDYEFATVYRRGIGVYQSNSRSGRLFKVFGHAPGCGFITAEELLRDLEFKRTEIVLGLKAYVLSKRFAQLGYVMETYYVPELGRIPFKRIYIFDNGQKWVTEPISVEFGEPAAADLYGPDYLVIEQIPIFNEQLDRQLVSKPDPVYPPAALARGISGTVSVSVIVDENGSVVSALANSLMPLLNEAATEAAYDALFLPTLKNGEPVIVSGRLVYKFTLPPAQEK
jgi:TonB family protein